MPYKFIPAIQKLKREIVAIGNDEIGKIYFLKRYCRVAGEREALDSTELQQNKGQFLLVKLADKISKDKGVSLDEAYKFIFPSESDEVVKDFNPMLEYPEEMQELIGLRSQTNRMKDAVATVLMQTRVAFPVELSANADINSESLHLTSLSFPLKDRDTVKFGNCKAIVVGNYEASEDEAAIAVKPISEKLAAGRIGFLAGFESGKERVGYSDWSAEDTKQLPETLIDAIYEFYQREAAGLPEVEEKVEEPAKNDQTATPTNSLLPSENLVSENQLTGESSTIELPVTA